MSDEELKKELDKAAGNNLIEGHEIDSLLYGVAVGIEDMNKQEETTYGKRKK